DEALARANDAQRSSLYALGGLSAVALLIALGVMAAVVVTVRPLTDLTEAAKRIGRGDYRPIEEPAKSRLGADEITLLTREFNSMARSLAERDAKLHEQHQKLLKSERLATVGRMTSLITHELRNPLSSINLNSEMLEEALREHGIDEGDGDDVMTLLSAITDEVERLRDITEEYLVYARLPSPDFEPSDLVEIVEGLVDFHTFEWSQEDIDVDLQVHADPLPALADPDQLRQALLNLVKNAVEASEPGQTVDLELDTAGDRAVIRLRDRGSGIDADDLDKIFDPFFTTKARGTGLGLAMTQQIVEEHRGDIEVESQPGQGTTFVIRLPLDA
ncbi:MAG: sensor histidine kinase, partial [Persicimonas sp.]